MYSFFTTAITTLFTLPAALAAGKSDTSGDGPTLTSPLGSGSTIYTLINNIVNFLITLSVSIALIMVLYGAFQILTSGGKPDQVKTGRQTIVYALVGLVIVIIAKGLIGVVESVVGKI